MDNPQPSALSCAPINQRFYEQFSFNHSILQALPDLGIAVAMNANMNKVLRQPAPTVLRIAGIISKLRASFRFQIPVGYQDERGFHYGVERAKK